MKEGAARRQPLPSLYFSSATTSNTPPLSSLYTLLRLRQPPTTTASLFRNFKMFNSNIAAVAKALEKRKVREAVTVTDTPAAAAADLRLNLQGPHHHHHASSSRPLNRQLFKNKKTAPFSYMALLTGDHIDEDEDEDEDDDEYYSMAKDIKNQSDQINQIISFHDENLKQSVIGVLEKHNHSLRCAAEERAAKRQKTMRELQLEDQVEQNAQLLRLVDHYRAESERLQRSVRYLEQAAIARHNGEEEGESSFEDPDRVSPVRLDCKVCGRQLATVLVLPCRHVCICTRCEPGTKYCPVCRSIKTSSVEVCLPLD